MTNTNKLRCLFAVRRERREGPCAGIAGLARAVSILVLVLSLGLAGCSQTAAPATDPTRLREYANALYNRGLYQQAVQEYRRYLEVKQADAVETANIEFTIANVYFERLHDYENALAAYLKVKHLYPESQLMREVDRQIVACLERLDRSADAKQALDEAAALEPGQIQPSRPGTVLAAIGERKITSGDLDHLIAQMPSYLQPQFRDKAAKEDLLKNYIATELLYDAAKRKGLEREKEVVDAAFEAKKSFMVQKYLAEELKDQIAVQAEDVELYYKANKERYVEKDEKGKIKKQKSFEEAREQAAADLTRDKQKKAVDALLARMMTAEKVEIFTDRLK
jgi:tetratricopeptide (TPR) repeat protein